MPSQEIALTGIEARGRNGWFKPASALVSRYAHDGGHVHVWISSKQAGQMPPILFVLPREEADTLGRAMLTDVAAALAEQGEQRRELGRECMERQS